MKDFDWFGFVVFLVFNGALAAIGITITMNPISWATLNILFLVGNIRSEMQGRRLALDELKDRIDQRFHNN